MVECAGQPLEEMLNSAGVFKSFSHAAISWVLPFVFYLPTETKKIYAWLKDRYRSSFWTVLSWINSTTHFWISPCSHTPDTKYLAQKVNSLISIVCPKLFCSVFVRIAPMKWTYLFGPCLFLLVLLYWFVSFTDFIDVKASNLYHRTIFCSTISRIFWIVNLQLLKRNNRTISTWSNLPLKPLHVNL